MIRAIYRRLGIIPGFDFDPDRPPYAERTS
ncbi:hypothetical protein KPSA3_05205 [Pseudomonas syringae pv. actinidiae]|uniref:Uncharacterized protein n=1 Tax=Pseudomonas syringae pv. actinidiae TaxID=103796 RepID=A0AAN4TNC8_PSESF|nr:hypothetical protein KPSA3_05205 [Pseudomonas syringae pv. actinidiae]